MKKNWLLLVGPLAFILGAGTVWWGGAARQAPPKPPQPSRVDFAPLKEQLEQAAEKSLPTPSLGVWQVEITVPAAELDQRIVALQALTSALQGSATRGIDRDKAAVLLIRIPEAAKTIFAQRAAHWPLSTDPLPVYPAGGETSDGEVILHPSPAS